MMINYTDPKIYTSTLLPIGKSGIESLNRFVGAHKRYNSPTEFGSTGEINNKAEGSFTMGNHGILLTPESYSFCSYLKAEVAEHTLKEKKFGLSLYKNGLSILGSEFIGPMPVDELKGLTGQLSYKITNCIIPALNDEQKSLLSALIQEEDLSKSWSKISSYFLVVCEESPFQGMSVPEILEKESAQIEALTDWVISTHKIGEGTLFLGMAGMLYLGKQTDEVDEILKNILFLRSCNVVSHQLYALLWSFRKQFRGLKQSSKKGNYKVIKGNVENICTLNDSLSKIEIFDNFLRNETEIVSKDWGNVKELDSELYQNFLSKFHDEVDKSIERNQTIIQLTNELEVLSSEQENRLELIMTKDSMTLNAILLTFTVISVIGLGEVVDFNQKQWLVVAIVVFVFGVISFGYLRNLIKNFYKR